MSYLKTGFVIVLLCAQTALVAGCAQASVSGLNHTNIETSLVTPVLASADFTPPPAGPYPAGTPKKYQKPCTAGWRYSVMSTSPLVRPGQKWTQPFYWYCKSYKLSPELQGAGRY